MARQVKRGANRKAARQFDDNVVDIKRSRTKIQSNNLELTNFTPLTENQSKAFSLWDDGKHLCLHGVFGSGKTFLALGLAFEALSEDESLTKIIIVRSTCPVRDQGALPGGPEEKQSHYEMPYITNCNKLFKRADAYTVLKTKGVIEFTSTSFLRGQTFENCIVIFDEFQNANQAEGFTVIERIGENCRLIISGDEVQSDLNYKKNDVSAAPQIIKILKKMPSVGFVEFGIEDILRSGFAKEWAIAKAKST